MLTRWLARVLFVTTALALAGCGANVSNNPVSSSAPPSINAANLSGNWLLAGTLPVSYAMAPNTFGLAATFDVTGNEITGVAYMSGSCGSTSLAAVMVASPVSGTVAADGTLSLTTTQLITTTTPTVTIQGKAPTSSSGTWAGTYSITGNCVNPVTGSLQPFSYSGAVQSTALPLFNGTYASGLTSTTLAGTSTTTTTLKLQQGGQITNTATGVPGPYSNLVMTGTISIQGPSCQKTGTTQGAMAGSTPVVSVVSGDSFTADFLLNDGTQILARGSMSDTQANQLTVSMAPTFLSSCSGQFIFPVATLNRQ
jgi:hypothetical protein